MSERIIKAIESRYNGRRYRSRLEARWAVYFDALGIPFEYEREGYTDGKESYLPDFWLPDVQMRGGEPGVYVEVKPDDASASDNDKIWICPKDVIAVVGEPPGYGDGGAYQYGRCDEGREWWDNYMRLLWCLKCKRFKWEFMEGGYYRCSFPNCKGICVDGEDAPQSIFAKAKELALSARFEFGEGQQRVQAIYKFKAQNPNDASSTTRVLDTDKVSKPATWLPAWMNADGSINH